MDRKRYKQEWSSADWLLRSDLPRPAQHNLDPAQAALYRKLLMAKLRGDSLTAEQQGQLNRLHNLRS